jgi:hypothetical protein
MGERVQALCSAVVQTYGGEGYRSVADIVDAASLTKVREHKKAMKAAATS